MQRFYHYKKTFYLDGKEFLLQSGAIHYFRVPKIYWYDRLLKLKECGLNCVETYVPWNLHEKEEGVFDFSDNLDLLAFIDTAKDLGLYTIIRPGPYICAEWESGGLPYWLKNYADLQIRTYNARFLEKVEKYLLQVVRLIKPYLIENGGNILMLQIENEYGTFYQDKKYLNALKSIYDREIPECMLFTADGAWEEAQNGGRVENVIATATFSTHKFEIAMNLMEQLYPDQPQNCMEYWCGWFDHWGAEHQTVDTEMKLKGIEYFLQEKYGFNIYMFHGGTNFGFMNGSNCNEYVGGYQPTVTSYDYDAFLTESGDRTEAYYALRELLKKYNGEVPPLTAKETEKRAYGKVKFIKYASLFDNLKNIAMEHISNAPLTFSQLRQAYGYVYYQTQLNGESFTMTVHDRVNIYLDGEYNKTFNREGSDKVTIEGWTGRLGLLVENMGCINYGLLTFDDKGILETEGISEEKQWTTISLPMENLNKLKFSNMPEQIAALPAFYKGEIEVDEICDTFLRTDGFKKGFVLINGFNIGRYWEIGPQKTLYVPASLLKRGKNEVMIFDADGAVALDAEFVAQQEL